MGKAEFECSLSYIKSHDLAGIACDFYLLSESESKVLILRLYL